MKHQTRSTHVFPVPLPARPVTKIFRAGARALAAVALALGNMLAATAQPIPGQYIAVFRDDVSNVGQAARDLEIQHGVSVSHVYQNSIRGLAFTGSAQAAEALARNPRIAYVEQDQMVHANIFPADPIPSGVSRIGINVSLLETISPAKQNVDARIAIIDTGLDRNHPDLNVDPYGVRPYYKTVKGKTVVAFDNNFDDDNGHGTHVGGTAAANGAIVGVAPGALLTAVKVLGANGSGQNSIVIAGVDWVAGQPERFDVANMSLGGGFSQASNDAVQRATEKGIVFVVSAGNASTDVSQMSPASEPSAITVSAMVDYDGAPGAQGTGDYVSCRNSDGTGGTLHPDEAFACFSNFGEGVDICAPGVLIDSTWPTTLGDQSGYHTISGTSMAAPHVTGAAALYIATYRAGRTETRAWVDEVTLALTTSGWRVGDYGYFDYFTRDASLPRPTGDKDYFREPLLNVSALLGATTRPNPDFKVTIFAPMDQTTVESGAQIDFTATASLGSEDLTSAIVWTSSRDGVLGYGGGISTILTDGTHSIVASVQDSSVSTFGGAASITIVSGQPTAAPKQLLVALTFNKPGDPPVYYDGETMISNFDVTDELGVPVQDAWVSSVMKTPNGGTLTASGYSDANGRFEASAKLNGKRGGGYDIYTITGSATESGYLRSTEVTRAFELRR